MTLSSTSTLAEVKAAYDDNAAYAESASVTMARAFATACRILLRRLPKRATHGGAAGGETIELDPVVLREELTAAENWADARDTSGGGYDTTFADLTDFRR